MNEQPEALRLADWLDGSNNGPADARHKAAAELRRLHEANESFAKRQTWWNNRTFELENALRKAVMALSNFDSQKRLNAIATAKQALGEKT